MTPILVAAPAESDVALRADDGRGDHGRTAVADWVRVLIADPDGLARRMISGALQESEGMAVIASVADGVEALELTRHYRPDVLLVDSLLTAGGSIEFVHEAHEASPETRILILSTDSDAEAMMAALQAGAIGHVGKDVDPDRLVELVTRAAAGEAIVSPQLVGGLLERLRQLPETGWRPLHSRLTTREWEVIDLLADEASTEEIADRLVLSIETVYSHVKSLVRKLGVAGRREAVVAARELRHDEVMGRNLTNAGV
jgi:DNA-binding NarL/FixJ family response regulator